LNPPATIAALKDRRLKRRDLIVYAVALEHLSYYQPRPFKVRVVAKVLSVHFGDAGQSIRRLLHFGYLETGPKDGKMRTYLLRESADPTALAS
jgi:hypothetical protein